MCVCVGEKSGCLFTKHNTTQAGAAAAAAAAVEVMVVSLQFSSVFFPLCHINVD